MAGGLEGEKKKKKGESYLKHLGEILKEYKLLLYHLQALDDSLYQIKILFVF